jgi:hypothetical protein
VFTSPGPDPWAEIHDGAQEEDRADPPAPDCTIVKALEGAIALPVIFDKSPQEVIHALAGINVVLSQFISNFVQKVS